MSHQQATEGAQLSTLPDNTGGIIICSKITHLVLENTGYRTAPRTRTNRYRAVLPQEGRTDDDRGWSRCIYEVLFLLLLFAVCHWGHYRAGGPHSPCLHGLTLSTPEPRQFPLGTQKPALSGFTVRLANTLLGGEKRYPLSSFTVMSSTYVAYRDLGRTQVFWFKTQLCCGVVMFMQTETWRLNWLWFWENMIEGCIKKTQHASLTLGPIRTECSMSFTILPPPGWKVELNGAIGKRCRVLIENPTG